MRYQLNDSVRLLPKVGPTTAAELVRMGIETVGDLLLWYPRRYLDASHPVPLRQASINQESVFQLTIDTISEGFTKRRGLRALTAKAHDDSGKVVLQFYNQPYLIKQLLPGSRWVCIGGLRPAPGGLTLISPRLERRAVILPVYRQSKKVSSRFLNSLIAQALPLTEIESALPSEIQEKFALLPTATALERLHLPTSLPEIAAAQSTQAFTEVWEFFVDLERLTEPQTHPAPQIPADADWLKKVSASLPFKLTAGQKRAIWDAAQDLASGTAMVRLLNGDVGSGKTVVAGMLASLVAKAGWQTAILAPTQILAEQHAQSLQKLFQRAGLRIALWTGNTKEKHAPEADLVVGTHALLTDPSLLPKLGLVVVDEQHRFGVEQRTRLVDGRQLQPHFLSMTATPIPRTLALSLFANLKLSTLPERPVGRLPVQTQIIKGASGRQAMYERLQLEAQAGQTSFVICPMITAAIEEAEELNLFDPDELAKQGQKAVQAEVERLQKALPKLKIGSIHGKMKSAEKTQIMADFANQKLDVLVGTSVVEVGVDIPHATVMVIEGAELFGLAQLHQLRGRVGRSRQQSYCFLCPHGEGEAAQKRLQILVDSNDGFEIAEADLAERGPGNLAGQLQSGLPNFKLASISDLTFLREVRETVMSYLAKHPDYQLLAFRQLDNPKLANLE